MDPITTAALVSALGTGLFEVFKIVFTKGLESGIIELLASPLRDWVARGYDEKQDAAALLAAQDLGFRVHGTVGLLIRSARLGLRSRENVILLLRSLPEISTLYIRPALLQENLDRLRQEWR